MTSEQSRPGAASLVSTLLPLLLSALLPTTAAAQPATAAAQPATQTTALDAAALAAWKEGKALFEAGRHRRALKDFLRGHALSGRVGFLFNAAECARLLGDKQQAYHLYRRYLLSGRGLHRAEAASRCRALAAGPCPSADAGKKETRLAPGSSTAAAAGLSPTSATPAMGSGETASRVWYRRWYVWVWAAVGAGIVSGAIAAVAAGGGGPTIPPEAEVHHVFGALR